MSWSTFDIAAHACDVYEPPTLRADGGMLIYLHGVHLNRLDDKPAFISEFDRHGLRVVCPWTARSWWTDRICAEFDPAISAEAYVLRHVLPAIAERWNVSPPMVALLGTSMGGQGALRFAFKYPATFPVVAAISPAIDYQQRMQDGDETLSSMYDDAETARQDTATLHVHPLNWPRHAWFCCDPLDYRWHESAERLRSKLYSLGVPHTCDLETTGGGHGFEYYNRMAEPAIGFIAENLAAESRRVV